MGSSLGKIVIVDDSPVILDLMREALSAHGYDVTATSNPFGFSNLLRREQPVLALVDVTMPALVGNQLVEIAQRAGGHQCQILLFSDRPEPELAELAKKCRASGYLRKDGDIPRLVKSIETYLQK